jgi:hypothetical protein
LPLPFVSLRWSDQKVKVHLVTVVGSDVKLLPHMLRHYRRMGIESFIVNLHLEESHDPVRRQVERITQEFGCDISNVIIGKWSNRVNRQLYSQSRTRANDWYILADLDEFHRYPGNLGTIIDGCNKKGRDFIEGCVIDRISSDGGFPKIASDKPIEEQFRLGCIFTHAILEAYPIKVVAAKGFVELSEGNHYATNGRCCPINECFAQVHHYKWDDGVLDRSRQRLNAADRLGGYSRECHRLLDYASANNGRINISDARLLVAECNPGYKYWDLIKSTVAALPKRFGHGLEFS